MIKATAMPNTRPDQQQRSRQLLRLLVVVAASIPFTAAANRLIGEILARHDPSLAAVSHAAIPSFLLIAMAFAFLGRRSLLAPPSAGELPAPILRLSALWMTAWLSGAVILASTQGYWPTYVHDWPSRIGFLVFGPLGEELLFRGIVQERARLVWHQSTMPAILISSAAFSLHHLFIRTAPEGLLIPQLLFTIPMGIVFATLRERTGSLRPSLALHFLTNLPFAI